MYLTFFELRRMARNSGGQTDKRPQAGFSSKDVGSERPRSVGGVFGFQSTDKWLGGQQETRKPAQVTLSGLRSNNPGGFLLSHAVARAVPSAPRGLTSVFGMGTGVTLSTQPPENCFSNLSISNCGSRALNLRSEI